jgi:uncharacterized protein YcbK (DUF882 family)/LysM repeat protein
MVSVISGSRRSRAAWAAALLGLALAVLPVAASAAEVEHVVAKGHTLGKIARRYHTTVDALREANGLKPGERIRPGQRLIIPERGKEAEAARTSRAAPPNPRGAAALRKDAERQKAGAEKPEPQGGGKAAGRSANGQKGDREGKRKEKGYARRPKRPGLVRLIRGTEELEIQLLARSGRLDPKALPKLSRLLRSPGGAIPIDPRLATLIGMVSNHFGGRTLRVVSGYRPYSPTQHTQHSNHNVGRAIDFSIEGVPNTAVRDFCRTFRNAGVGYYPNSTFVHLDVRSGKVYWVDYSRPGEPPRYDLATPAPSTPETVYEVIQATRSSGQERSTKTHQLGVNQLGNLDGITRTPVHVPSNEVKGGLEGPHPPSATATPGQTTQNPPAQP